MINEFLDLGIEVKSNAIEQKVKCPKCNQTRKNKNDKSLSVNIEKGLYNCHHCGWGGNVKFRPKKEFVKPPEATVDLGDRAVSWFNKRGISKATLSHCKVSESTEYFPQISKSRKAINFNYYRNGELINVKYRDGEKNFKLVSGAELIFYGLDNIKESKKIYIVEGEMDA